jgi:hypothetical protein
MTKVKPTYKPQIVLFFSVGAVWLLQGLKPKFFNRVLVSRGADMGSRQGGGGNKRSEKGEKLKDDDNIFW